MSWLHPSVGVCGAEGCRKKHFPDDFVGSLFPRVTAAIPFSCREGAAHCLSTRLCCSGSGGCQVGDGEDTSVAHDCSNAHESSNRQALVASLDALSPLCTGQWVKNL